MKIPGEGSYRSMPEVVESLRKFGTEFRWVVPPDLERAEELSKQYVPRPLPHEVERCRSALQVADEEDRQWWWSVTMYQLPMDVLFAARTTTPDEWLCRPDDQDRLRSISLTSVFRSVKEESGCSVVEKPPLEVRVEVGQYGYEVYGYFGPASESARALGRYMSAIMGFPASDFSKEDVRHMVTVMGEDGTEGALTAEIIREWTGTHKEDPGVDDAKSREWDEEKG